MKEEPKMQQRPHIGVPTQTLQVIDGIPEGLPRSWVMNHRYYTALESVGALPWMVPLLNGEDTLRGMYEHMDGVFLAGGIDVDPSMYGAEPDPLCGTTDPDRDRVELLFARWALEDGKPLLGVCRGMQVLNVAAGGTLHQDCTAYWPGAIKHDYFPTEGYARDFLAHEARLVPGTHVSAALGGGTVRINSMHHQGVQQLGSGLRASAFAPDELIEAVERIDESGTLFQVGVQWHPEMLIDSDAGTRQLFRSFIDAALAFRELKNVLA
jgi:putative glutamine amidotransferase